MASALGATDRRLLERALALGRQGLGRTAPNPPVGAVVARGEDILGEGSHPGAGQPHAEPLALAQAGEAARGATAYVSLEPCCHHGRTPPCTEALLDAGVARVVYGCPDPDPRVAGGGAARLRAEGLEVELAGGDLRRAAEDLISGFASRVLRGRPQVLLKAAASLDGQLAPATGNSKWITGPEARARGHRLRDQSDAVLVGSQTALVDDPALTVRDPTPRDGRQPLRILLDGRGRVPAGARMGGRGALVFTGPASEPAWRDAWSAAGAEVVAVPAGPAGGVDLIEVLATLGRRGLGQVMVEGGGAIHGALLQAGLADRLALFLAPRLLGAAGFGWSGGWAAAEVAAGLGLRGMVVEPLGPDLLIEGEIEYPGAEED